MSFPSEVRYTYDHQRPACGVDVAVFWWDKKNYELYLATIRRGKEPFVGKLALPGGHINPGEDGFGERVEDAGMREVEEETSLELMQERMRFVGFYDEPHRDPRGWRITFLYFHSFSGIEPPKITAGDDAAEAFWTNLTKNDLIEDDWAFDHYRLVLDAWNQWVQCQ
jgi:8-oxo-dGTP diphosphatase